MEKFGSFYRKVRGNIPKIEVFMNAAVRISNPQTKSRI
jgi:hypothetical protein